MSETKLPNTLSGSNDTLNDGDNNPEFLEHGKTILSLSGSQISDQQNKELETLRHLLFKDELTELKEIKQLLINKNTTAKELSQVLAEAILLRNQKDQSISIALKPTVESILKESVKVHPAELADSIFPLMGPAIRKAITESFGNMLHGFNKTLELVFSWRGLKWRIEALRTGKPFSEVVLIHTLQYSVEQVFLIHSESGILLAEVNDAGIENKDSDLMSSMLTAIQDFVRDCFDANEEEALE